jgi:PAS domain-containing protein
MISYLGFPIVWPTGDIFGTICVLDDRTNSYSEAYQRLMLQCRDVIEADLTARLAVHARLTEEARAKLRLEQQVAARTADLVHVNDQILREIADRTRAEEAVRVSRELLQAVIDSTTAVIFVKDIEGRYMFINRRYEELFGIDRGTIVGRTDYVPPRRARPRHRAHVRGGCLRPAPTLLRWPRQRDLHLVLAAPDFPREPAARPEIRPVRGPPVRRLTPARGAA